MISIYYVCHHISKHTDMSYTIIITSLASYMLCLPREIEYLYKIYFVAVIQS